MELEIDVMGALCELSIFRINDIEADYADFGEKYDASPETAEDYGCGNMQFFSNPATAGCLSKYKISTDEYAEVCSKLIDLLSFGRCGWCV